MKSYDITPFEFDPDYDLDIFKVFFLDGTHSVPPWKPMNGWLWAEHCTHGLEWACQTLKLPTLKGLSFRLHHGGGYLGIYLIDDEDEIAEREEQFRQNLIPFLEDYDGHWERAVAEMLGHYARLKETDLDTCSRGRAAQELRRLLRRLQASVGAALPLHVRGLRGVHALRDRSARTGSTWTTPSPSSTS